MKYFTGWLPRKSAFLNSYRLFFAAAPVVPSGTYSGGSGAGGSGGASDGGAGTGGSGGGAPAGTDDKGAGGGQGGGQPTDNIREFRQAYDKLKTDYEPYRKFAEENQLDAGRLGNIHGVYQRLANQALEIGEQLGYEKDEILEAFEADPEKCLNYLRGQAEKGAQRGEGEQPDLNELVEAAISERMGPIEQAENKRVTDQANALATRVVREEMVKAFAADGIDAASIPADEAFMLQSSVFEILKYDQKALHALKFEGRTADVQKAFVTAKTYLDKYYASRYNREANGARRGPAGPQGPKGGNGGDKKFTLDEMIDDPARINPKYK